MVAEIVRKIISRRDELQINGTHQRSPILRVEPPGQESVTQDSLIELFQ